MKASCIAGRLGGPLAICAARELVGAKGSCVGGRLDGAEAIIIGGGGGMRGDGDDDGINGSCVPRIIGGAEDRANAS